MQKPVRRLQPCPCGSGRRFKDCHGRLERTTGGGTFEGRHGSVRPLTAELLDDLHAVQVGRKVIVTRGISDFSLFLDLYLRRLLHPNWIEKELSLPREEQHPVLQWRGISATVDTQTEGPLVRVRSGAGLGWFRLAYDLYLIEHNAELQKSLVARIRDRRQFQGARFEAAVAAMLLPSGYELEFVPIRGPGGKRPEYIATNRGTGQRIAVEAKSKHRPGILGFPGNRVEPHRLSMGRLLHDALSKKPAIPLLIFLELNVPRLLRDEENPSPVFPEIEQTWQSELDATRPGGFQAIGVVVYNDSAPWRLNELLPDGFTHVAAFAKAANLHRNALDPSPMLRDIVRGCYQRLRIPRDFPHAH